MATAAAAATMTTPTTERPRIVCADAGPEPPFPLRMEGRVISGFGRGSKELGIPTANLPVDGTAVPWIEDAKSGVYFGYASLALPAGHPDRLPGVATSSSSSSSAAAAAGAAQQRKEQQQEPSTSSTSSQQSPTATAGGNDDNDNNDSSNSSGEFQVYPMVMSIGYNPFYKNTVRSAEVHVLHAFRADFYGAHMRLLLLGYVRDELDYSGLEALVRDINIDCDIARNSLARRAWRPREGVIVAAAAAEGEGGAAGAAGGQGGDDEKKIVERGSLDGSWLVRPLDEGAAV